jgi:UDP-sugar transporter A1/2/3
MIMFLTNPKWRSLVLFLFQNSLLIIGLRACAIYSSATHVNHIASSVVVVTEFSKLLLSLAICFIFEAQSSFSNFRHILFKGFVDEAADCLKLMVPAVLYAIQNNLQYVIESAPLFLVVYQMKIITTAVFYSMLLYRRLSLKEWGCIFALSVGVSMVESSQNDILPHHASNIIGVLSVVVACLTSGFAGVYFEKITKSSKSSIWVLNVQMSLLSCFMCMVC